MDNNWQQFKYGQYYKIIIIGRQLRVFKKNVLFHKLVSCHYSCVYGFLLMIYDWCCLSFFVKRLKSVTALEDVKLISPHSKHLLLVENDSGSVKKQIFESLDYFNRQFFFLPTYSAFFPWSKQPGCLTLGLNGYRL